MKTVGFQGDDHLMHRRRSHPEKLHHVSFSGSDPMNLGVVENESQVWPCFAVCGFFIATGCSCRRF
jgi:hypothetical protein